MQVVVGGAAATRRVGGHDLEKQGRRDFCCGGGEDGGQLSRTAAAAAGRRPRTPSVGLRDGEFANFYNVQFIFIVSAMIYINIPICSIISIIIFLLVYNHYA